jgi:hypothetical protein
MEIAVSVDFKFAKREGDVRSLLCGSQNRNGRYIVMRELALFFPINQKAGRELFIFSAVFGTSNCKNTSTWAMKSPNR